MNHNRVCWWNCCLLNSQPTLGFFVWWIDWDGFPAASYLQCTSQIMQWVIVDRFSCPQASQVEVPVGLASRTTPEDLWEVWHVVAGDWHKHFALLVGIEVSITIFLFPLYGFAPLLYFLPFAGHAFGIRGCSVVFLHSGRSSTNLYSSGGSYIPQTHFRDTGPVFYAARVSKFLSWSCNIQ